MNFTSVSPEATERIGERLGKLLIPGDVVALIGDLGTGKTRLTHGIARGLGLKPGHSVNSPSYVLINEYPADHLIYHIDLYRIKGAVALLDLGLEEYLYGDGVCVIEWADRAESWLPAEHLQIQIEWVNATTRMLTLHPNGESLTRRIQDFDWECADADPGD